MLKPEKQNIKHILLRTSQSDVPKVWVETGMSEVLPPYLII